MSTSELPQGWLETASSTRGPCKLHYRETHPRKQPAQGQGGAPLPIVFLHGLCGGSGEWTAVMDILGDTHQLYALDLPGHCESPMADEDFSMVRLLLVLLGVRVWIR
jgi:pimeloyl-ACP methyl ester carboxylesterase